MTDCDLCGTTMRFGATSYSAIAVKKAVHNGLRPSGPAAALAAALGQDLNTGWVQMAMADTTDWILCPNCASRLEEFLGPTLKTQKYYGESVDEAMAAAEAAATALDNVQEIKVTRNVQDETAHGKGRDANAAIEDARRRVPSDLFSRSSSAEIIQTGERGTEEIQAQTAAIARQQWRSRAPEGATLDGLECKIAPRSGFLGLGKKPGVWKANWSTPFRAQISYTVKAEVTLTYRE